MTAEWIFQKKTSKQLLKPSSWLAGRMRTLGGAGAVGEFPETFGYAPGGYRKRKPDDYDRGLCLDPGPVLDFIYATQPKEWEKFKKQHGADAKDRFLKRLSSEIQKRGTLDVFRKGIKSDGCKFQLADRFHI